jgi:hypothetical protein
VVSHPSVVYPKLMPFVRKCKSRSFDSPPPN